MKSNKEIMKAFQEQFNTGRLFTEAQVLVLMGYARGEERRTPSVAGATSPPGGGENQPARKAQFQCPHSDIECPHIDLSGMDKLVDCSECDLNPCVQCGHMNEEICNTCTIIQKKRP